MKKSLNTMSPVPLPSTTIVEPIELPTTLKTIHHPPTHGFSTQAIHTGSGRDPHTSAVIPPISLSTTFAQSSIGVHKGYEYSRSGNPNRDALESLLAGLEGGASGGYAIAFSSGSAATMCVIQSLGPGAHILSVNDVYGGTFRYMTKVAEQNQGVTTTFLDLTASEADEAELEERIASSILPNTRLIWIESPTNPTLRLIDVSLVSRVAQAHPSKPLVLVDNTFLSPFYGSPILQGADIVLHSLTKYVNGHSDVVMGALILPPHHSSLHTKIRFLQNATGAVPSPYDCWLLQRGAKTLGVRMKQHGLNGLSVAKALKENIHIEDVIYPGLKSAPNHLLAWKSLSKWAREWIEETLGKNEEGDFPFSGMVSFRLSASALGLDGSALTPSLFEATNHLLEYLSTPPYNVFTLAESLGGIESLIEHPASMTHASIPADKREELGIGEGLVRVSCGIEESGDLLQALREGLEELSIWVTSEKERRSSEAQIQALIKETSGGAVGRNASHGHC